MHYVWAFLYKNIKCKIFNRKPFGFGEWTDKYWENKILVILNIWQKEVTPSRGRKAERNVILVCHLYVYWSFDIYKDNIFSDILKCGYTQKSNICRYMELWIYAKIRYLQMYGNVELHKDQIFADIWKCGERVKAATWHAGPCRPPLSYIIRSDLLWSNNVKKL